MTDELEHDAVKLLRTMADQAREAARVLRSNQSRGTGGLQPERLAGHYDHVAENLDEHIRQIVGE